MPGANDTSQLGRARVAAGRSRVLATCSGWILVVASACLLPIVSLKLGRMPGALGLQLVLGVSGIGAACGLLVIFRGAIFAQAQEFIHNEAVQDLLLPRVSGHSLALSATCSAMLAVLMWHGWSSSNPEQSGHRLLLTMAMFDGAVTWTLATLAVAQLLRLLGIPPFLSALVPILPLALLIPVESLLLYFGGERLGIRNFGEASAESISAYLGLRSLLVIGSVFLISVTGAFMLSKCVENSPKPLQAARNAAIAVLFGAMPLTYAAYLGLSAGSHYASYINTLSLRQKMEALAKHPVVHLLAEYHTVSSERLSPLSAEETRAIACTQGLRVGQERHYAELSTNRSARVIICVFIESLGGCFLSRLNPNLPGQLMPNLDALAEDCVFLTNYHGVNFPTTPGLCSSLASHPNYRVVDREAWCQSVARQLVAAGWDTAFLSSVSTAFDHNDARFKRLGFSVVEGAQHWTSEDRAGLISEWGLPDRALFDKCLELISKPRDRPLFIALLTCDTHNPTGRIDYRGLVYPPTPSWISKVPDGAAWLSSFYRLDHDLNSFVSELRRNKEKFDETVVVITGDHNPPLYGDVPKSLGLRDVSMTDPLPLIMLSGLDLPEPREDRVHSQLDLAPTLLHIAGVKVPTGYWGDSIFADVPRGTSVVSLIGDRVTVLRDDSTYTFSKSERDDPTWEGLRQLLDSYEQNTLPAAP